jgi:hypothetical protein
MHKVIEWNLTATVPEGPLRTPRILLRTSTVNSSFCSLPNASRWDDSVSVVDDAHEL